MYFNSKDRDLDGLISFDEFCDRETINERSFRAIDQVNHSSFQSNLLYFYSFAGFNFTR